MEVIEVTPKIEINRKTLIEALKSGKYEQAHFIRQVYNRFCVLGLIGFLFNDDKSPWVDHLDTHLGLPNSSSFRGFLASLNNDGKTFPEIADYLINEHGFPDVR